MRTIRRFLHDVRSVVRGRAAVDDLSDELNSFLEAAVAHKMRSGMSRDAATRAARLEMGSALSVREAVGDVGWTAAWENTWRDFRYGTRSLARNGSFTLAAVATLALGVGITTAVFSVVNTVVLQPLPYRDADRLVRIVERAAPRAAASPLLRRTSMTWSEMVEWRARTATLAELAYTISPPITLMPTPEGSVRLSGALVSSNVFSMLGAHALLGRTLDARDEAPGSNTVVISALAWQRYFQGDPGIVGRMVALKTQGPEAGLLDGTPRTVVGVMTHEFDYPVPYCDYWAPIAADSKARRTGSGAVIARLRDGISAGAAADEANVIGEGLRPKPTSGPLAQPLPQGTRRFDVEPIKEQAIAATRPALTVLALAVGVLLLIACANVATLLLARGTARRREVAVRLALGASRSRIARQMLAESLVLTAIGGGLGVLLAVGGVQALRSLASPNAQGPFLISFGGAMIPRLNEVAVDGRMLVIAVAVSAFTALVISVLPALRLSRIDHVQAMDARGASGAGGDIRVRNLLVAGQVATATVLLVGAGLLINSFDRLARVDPGWNASGLLTFYLVAPQEYTTQRKATLINDLLAELRRTPAVRAAGFTYAGPLLGLVDHFGVFVPPGRTPEEMRDVPDAPQIRSVSHDFLQAVGARLLAGRWLEPRDDAGAPPVIVINRSLATRFFESGNPVGQMVHLDGRMDLPPQQIVGVVDDLRQARLDQEPAPQFFVDYRQVLALTQARRMPVPAQERLAFGFLSFVVRTDGNPDRLTTTVRSLIGRVDANVGIDALLPMEQLVASSLTRQRFYAAVMGVFAGIALLLSAIGIYGVLAYSVGQRTREFGVRTALGARSRDVLAMVVRQGLRLACIGIVIGLAGASALTRYIEGMLYGVTPVDRLTYAAVVALFGATASIACYLPARRATRIDPMTALRYE
jgi:putative ABC transport system permease protein